MFFKPNVHKLREKQDAKGLLKALSFKFDKDSSDVSGIREEAAMAFKQVAKIEAHHRARYEKLIAMVEAGTVFKREEPIKWKCSICGYTYEGIEPPPRCPYCKRPREYYEPANLDV